jgi:hypothetical protein
MDLYLQLLECAMISSTERFSVEKISERIIAFIGSCSMRAACEMLQQFRWLHGKHAHTPIAVM